MIKGILHYKFIWRCVKPYKFSFINLFFCVLVTSFIGMTYPYLFGLLIDEVFYHQNREIFMLIIIIYGTIFVAEIILHFINNSTWSYLMNRFLFDIRIKLFEKTMRMKASQLKDIQTGNILTVINNDTNHVMDLIHRNFFWHCECDASAAVDRICCLY